MGDESTVVLGFSLTPGTRIGFVFARQMNMFIVRQSQLRSELASINIQQNPVMIREEIVADRSGDSLAESIIIFIEPTTVAEFNFTRIRINMTKKVLGAGSRSCLLCPVNAARTKQRDKTSEMVSFFFCSRARIVGSQLVALTAFMCSFGFLLPVFHAFARPAHVCGTRYTFFSRLSLSLFCLFSTSSLCSPRRFVRIILCTLCVVRVKSHCIPFRERATVCVCLCQRQTRWSEKDIIDFGIGVSQARSAQCVRMCCHRLDDL